MNAKTKRTVRTVFQTALALAGGLPVIVEASGVPEKTGGVVLALAIAGGVTRVMALPVVERVLDLVGLGFVTAPDSAPGDDGSAAG